MAEGGGWSVWVSLPHTSVTTTGSSSSKPGGQGVKRKRGLEREGWRENDRKWGMLETLKDNI